MQLIFSCFVSAVISVHATIIYLVKDIVVINMEGIYRIHNNEVCN